MSAFDLMINYFVGFSTSSSLLVCEIVVVFKVDRVFIFAVVRDVDFNLSAKDDFLLGACLFIFAYHHKNSNNDKDTAYADKRVSHFFVPCFTVNFVRTFGIIVDFYCIPS